MISVNTYNQKGEVVSKTQLNENIFGVRWNADLVHQAVVAQIANKRQVLAHTKDKGEVRGGGRKPWRQKGTGRARHGSIRSPLWRGGGVTFGPTKARNFAKKINKKMKRKALFMALSSKLRDKEIIVLDDLVLEKPKTKKMSRILVGLFTKISPFPALPPKKGEGEAKETVNTKPQAKTTLFKKDRSEILLVLPQKNREVTRASQNLPYLKTILADSLNVVDVLKYRYLVILKTALRVIEQHFQSEKRKAKSLKPQLKT